MNAILRNILPAVVGAGVALLAGAVVTAVWGPIFGVYGYRAVTAGFMILEAFAVVGVVEFFRSPNPYSRLYALYDLRDLGPTGTLESSDPRWLWVALPLVFGATALILSHRWF